VNQRMKKQEMVIYSDGLNKSHIYDFIYMQRKTRCIRTIKIEYKAIIAIRIITIITAIHIIQIVKGMKNGDQAPYHLRRDPRFRPHRE